jgi:hypothetical protein
MQLRRRKKKTNVVFTGWCVGRKQHLTSVVARCDMCSVYDPLHSHEVWPHSRPYVAGQVHNLYFVQINKSFLCFAVGVYLLLLNRSLNLDEIVLLHVTVIVTTHSSKFYFVT